MEKRAREKKGNGGGKGGEKGVVRGKIKRI